MDLSGLFSVLILGGIAGWAASKIIRGSGQGLLTNIVIGIIGAFIGEWLFDLLDLSIDGGLIGSIITATTGAIVLLWLAVNIK
mgnify:CR=1 FL=1